MPFYETEHDDVKHILSCKHTKVQTTSQEAIRVSLETPLNRGTRTRLVMAIKVLDPLVW